MSQKMRMFEAWMSDLREAESVKEKRISADEIARYTIDESVCFSFFSLFIYWMTNFIDPESSFRNLTRRPSSSSLVFLSSERQ